MPTSPTTQFKFGNKNVQPSLPTLGITTCVARTTRGPFNQPDTIIRTLNQFYSLYGREIVMDGTVSNIERALTMGSALRISRVAGSGTATKGIAKSYDPETEEPGLTPEPLKIEFVNPLDETIKTTFTFNIQTIEYGSSIVDPTSNSGGKDFFIQITSTVSGGKIKYYLTQFKSYSESNPASGSILDSRLLLSTSLAAGGVIFTDASVFEDFVRNVPNVELKLTSSSDASITNVEDVIAYIKNHQTSRSYIGNTAPTTEGVSVEKDFIINEGDNGGTSTKTEWQEAYEATRDYTDTYQIILSHVHQHIPLEWEQALKYVADINKVDFENILYVEIPKYDSNGDPMSPTAIVTKAKTVMAVIGQHKSIAYFCGGIKFYNNNGALLKNDVLGTVIGLGDISATNYGPWRSFSGANRGIVQDAIGPVTQNLGSPAQYQELQKLADSKLNLFVIKDTRLAGKQVMLWHGFTSEVLNSSDKFIASVRLQLYLKKNLRPILEKYLEEPNYIPTWQKIYHECTEVIDPLMPDAISEYTWNGDQNASNYSDMQVNNEADVRAGKYRVLVTYKDVVSLQVITMEFYVDPVSKSVTVNQ